LPGTLELLILQVLSGGGEMHGYGIAQQLRLLSDEVLQVGESSLYPALQRLLVKGWVKAEWGTSDNNRRASRRAARSISRSSAARLII
jgi:PadR family transcriptional regulator, regulatory protein PadR